MKSVPILPTPRFKHRKGFEKLTEDGRAKVIEEALFLTWDSLHSHLPWTHGTGKDKAFQKRCVQEYATLIHLISRLY